MRITHNSIMTNQHETNIFTIQKAEDGQKLFQYLQRKFNIPNSNLHRLIRTGQIRINSSRCKAFTHIHTNDQIRIPPLLLSLKKEIKTNISNHLSPYILETYGDIIVINKPTGIPTHPGTGHTDSIATRLATHFSNLPFTPTPAHRLDKDTTGILLVASSHSELVQLHKYIHDRLITKEYVAWVKGYWPYNNVYKIEQNIQKVLNNGFEKMIVTNDNHSKIARSFVFPLIRNKTESLLHILIQTGRTHQIRLQLSNLNFPIIGDKKYGQDNTGPLLLHSLRITLPNKKSFAILPPWNGKYVLKTLPKQIPEFQENNL